MIKKTLCLLLALLFVVGLCACDTSDADGKDTNTTSEASVEKNSSDDASSEDSKLPPPIPTINGSSVSEYTVVYVETTEEATYKAVAQELQSYLKDTFDVELEVRSESEEETEKEIIIGNSNKRALCGEYKDAYDYGKYKLVIKGEKVLFAASHATGAYQAYKHFKELVENSENGAFTDCEIDGEGKVIKVACVGDSITQGINSTDPHTQTYPHYLQEMLGLDYFVLNAGITDRSICKSDVYNYASTPQHLLAMDLKADVVIFALGTNDANPSHDYKEWTDDRKDVFKDSADELLDAYVDANKDVQIFMVLPSALFKVDEDKWKAEEWTENIVNYVHPLLKEIAEARDITVIDMYTWSKEHSDVFVDGLHPKDESYKEYAGYVYDCIKDSVKKP